MKIPRFISEIAVFFSLFCAFSGENDFYSSLEPAENQYVMQVNAYDWGPCVDALIIKNQLKVSKDAFLPEDFTVQVLIVDADASPDFPKGTRKISRIESDEKNVTLFLEVSPEMKNASPYAGLSKKLTGSDFYGYRIINKKLGIDISERKGILSPLSGQFKVSEKDKDGVSLKYAFWKPENQCRSEESGKNKAAEKKIPLLIWFHGIAEGGKNVYLPLQGTKAEKLISPEIQKYFPEGCAVIVPLCPTGWLETTTVDSFGVHVWAPYDLEQKIEKPVKSISRLFDRLSGEKTEFESDREDYVPDASVSLYSECVKKLLDDFLLENPEIDENRIYAGGCSAGGYMTINMVLQYRDFFAAAFTASEAFPDSKLTDSNIAFLSSFPLWFVYAENDETIKPSTHAAKTISRLQKKRPENLHVTVFKDVHDTSGIYYDEDGNPFQYDGHSSWICLLNDEVTENGKSFFKWLSEQSR